MKRLVIVNGTMGVGKSAVCGELLKLLTPGVYLDGDWCWNMNPFIASKENKQMVMDNIAYLLRSFLQNSSYQYVIFCRVLHQEGITQELLDRLCGQYDSVSRFSLVCRESTLRRRLQADVDKGIRTADVIGRSVVRLPLYDGQKTVKIDTTVLAAEQAARLICEKVRGSEAG